MHTCDGARFVSLFVLSHWSQSVVRLPSRAPPTPGSGPLQGLWADCHCVKPRSLTLFVHRPSLHRLPVSTRMGGSMQGGNPLRLEHRTKCLHWASSKNRAKIAKELHSINELFFKCACCRKKKCTKNPSEHLQNFISPSPGASCMMEHLSPFPRVIPWTGPSNLAVSLPFSVFPGGLFNTHILCTWRVYILTSPQIKTLANRAEIQNKAPQNKTPTDGAKHWAG